MATQKLSSTTTSASRVKKARRQAAPPHLPDTDAFTAARAIPDAAARAGVLLRLSRDPNLPDTLRADALRPPSPLPRRSLTKLPASMLWCGSPRTCELRYGPTSSSPSRRSLTKLPASMLWCSSPRACQLRYCPTPSPPSRRSLTKLSASMLWCGDPALASCGTARRPHRRQGDF